MTPSRAPTDGVQRYGTASDDGSVTILVAPARSKTTGKSMKTTSCSVMAKSCIITDRGRATGWLVSSVPDASCTRYSRNGSLNP